ncbi:MAG: Hsp70 family protein [Pseudomonadota bacterium]|nr:hypothetical protein [Gammaproteobacteria bacterium]MEC8010427.1 Hsp70 family protein [Pseudomonadota bacterium]HBF09068.1 hypothetical protein [Gammaproteobacteria bacterium]|tara:strand:- start:25661 stop:27526 length:1866 start_codon:yes stop_codon:yes gene_type:complete
MGLFGKKKAESTEVSAEPQKPLEEGQERVLGIDLGTTHTVMAVSVSGDEPTLELYPVQQTTGQGIVKAQPNLPSFLYLPGAETDKSDLVLPWDEAPSQLVGAYARELASKTPGRAVHSAKSWLSHQGADPRAANLPLHALDDVEKVSAFDVSKAYLAHLQANWDQQNPEQKFADQDIVLTVPASFDPAARELTAEAAKSLGLEKLTLLEEPQAATYAWIADHHDSWRDQLNVGDVILVVDVGGGTTDLSLIKVFEEDGEFGLERVAVGEHILLGGDNMDLALAYALSQKLAEEGKSLKPWQIMGMTHSCREAKETLFAHPDLESTSVVVPGRGTKLIGGTIKTDLTREHLNASLIDGFFPQVSVTDQPQKAARGGLTQMGLNYAQDAGITRHIAAFLTAHASDGEFVKPNAVLLNGGVFKADVLSERLIETLNSWLSAAGSEPVRLLAGNDLDASVARGAAYYGQVRQGKGLRIRGGLANTFYIGVESSMPAIPGMPAPVQALCVAPFGMEEGDSIEAVTSQTFGLIVGETVNFQFFGSSVRHDEAGTLLDDWDDGELNSLPDIQALVPETIAGQTRQKGEVVPVKLGARVTELGTLEVLACPVAGGDPWKVQLDVRENIK